MRVARPPRRRPVQDTLFFAGEATHLVGFAGTVHGAIETGERTG